MYPLFGVRSRTLKILFILLSQFLVLFSYKTGHSFDNENRTLKSANDFLYQLQNIDLIAIGETEYDLIIMDYSADGTGSQAWSFEQIHDLKSSNGGKIVLAYVSIGEAESYRFYWNRVWTPQDPDWLGQKNREWAGNYKVKYWATEWQDIILTYIDKIIDQGFDGIYMDIVDGYWYWANKARARGENEQLPSDQDAANRMISFIEKIALHCRIVRGKIDFILCPQNGSDIIHDASRTHVITFWRTIDAIGAEDTFYYGRKAEDNPFHPQKNTISNLDLFIEKGKRVFATDYLTIRNSVAINRFYFQCSKHGFIPFTTMRELDVLRINPGHEPD